jgi:diaminopropionate ammonia-lyase
MFLLNRHPDHRQPLTQEDAATLGLAGAAEAERFLAARDNHAETPLHALPGLAGELGIGALHVKDEGKRLGLGSFKALGGAYAVMRLVLE